MALVTGASSGIGMALAKVFARAGAAVALAARRKDRIDAEVAAMHAAGHRAIGLALDAGRTETFDASLDTIARELGAPPDVLLNCAGIALPVPIDLSVRARVATLGGRPPWVKARRIIVRAGRARPALPGEAPVSRPATA